MTQSNLKPAPGEENKITSAGVPDSEVWDQSVSWGRNATYNKRQVDEKYSDNGSKQWTKNKFNKKTSARRLTQLCRISLNCSVLCVFVRGIELESDFHKLINPRIRGRGGEIIIDMNSFWVPPNSRLLSIHREITEDERLKWRWSMWDNIQLHKHL